MVRRKEADGFKPQFRLLPLLMRVERHSYQIWQAIASTR